MWCEQQFIKFDARLKLDQSRADRIEKAVTRFREFCERDTELRRAMAEPPFLQGSVPSRTAIRPLGNDEYDVDVVYPFRLTAITDRSPGGVFRWFVDRIRQDEWYRSRMETKSRCVRVNYAGEFHVDFIPSTRDVTPNQPYAVPTRDLQRWITNDPRGLVDWIRNRDTASGMPDSAGDGAFVRGVRAMKRWRDQFFGSDARPSSILLTTILGKHEPSRGIFNPPLTDPLLPKYKADAAYLYDMLRLTHDCIQRGETRPLDHPTIQGEDLRRDWDAAFQARFMDRLAATIKAIRAGIYAATEAESARSYQQAFGETFPLE